MSKDMRFKDKTKVLNVLGIEYYRFSIDDRVLLRKALKQMKMNLVHSIKEIEKEDTYLTQLESLRLSLVIDLNVELQNVERLMRELQWK